jgi:putative ABC transport system permease protein
MIVYDNAPHEIVGVVKDVKDYGLANASRPVFYLPIAQYPRSSFKIALRAEGDAAAMTATVRQIVRNLEPDAVIGEVGTMTQWLSESLAGPRFSTFLLVTFSLIALLLAAVGLFGVMAFFITERSREIGIRIAIGAQPRHITSWVLAKGAVMAGSGLAAGLLASLATGRMMHSMLHATSPSDVVTYVAVTVTLSAVILAACLIPARRALHCDPRSIISRE